MKIAVTSTGPNLDDSMDMRFGRCAYFLVVETESMDVEAIQNPNIAVGGGAGIQSAQMMADRDVKAILTGNCGPNAYQTFNAAGVEVITGATGTVREAVEQYKAGNLRPSPAPNVQSHFGSGMGRGMGRGMGGGQGRGMGGGMGGGRGRGNKS